MNIRIDESELLAYIEGALAPSDRVRVEAALAQSSKLQASALAMQRDRAMLRELGARAAAPRGLVEEAIARAEREALLGGAVPSLSPAPRSLWKLAPVRVALAAGVALAVTAAVLAPSYLKPSTPPSGGLASATPAPKEAVSAPQTPAPASPVVASSEASRAPAAEAIKPEASAPNDAIALAPSAGGARVELLDPAQIVGPTPVSIEADKAVANIDKLSPAGAAALLRGGRLELRIVADRPIRVAARVEDLAVGVASDLLLLDAQGAPVRSVLNSGAAHPAGADGGYVFEAFGVPADAAWLEHAREWLSAWGGVRSAEFAPAEPLKDASEPGARMIIRVVPAGR